MSPKGILIAFLIVSLLLIGVMFLVVDGRNNAVLEKSPITETSTSTDETETLAREKSRKDTKQKESILDAFTTSRTINPNGNYQLEARVDSLKLVVQSQGFADLQKFNNTSEEIILQIKKLKEKLFAGGFEKHDLSASPRVEENNAVFFKQNDLYTEDARSFVTKLNAFENAIRDLKQKYPQLQNMQPKVRETQTVESSWLIYNFKDFPSVASYVKLTSLLDAILTKQEVIMKAVLN